MYITKKGNPKSIKPDQILLCTENAHVRLTYILPMKFHWVHSI